MVGGGELATLLVWLLGWPFLGSFHACLYMNQEKQAERAGRGRDDFQDVLRSVDFVPRNNHV